MVKNNRGVIGVALAIIVVCISIAGGYLYWRNRVSEAGSTITPTPTAITTATVSPTPNPLITQVSETQNKYTNTTYGISFTFPSDWSEGINTSYTQFGDLVALERRGETNIPNSELNDGINFSIGYPTELDTPLNEYINKILDDTEYLYGERPIAQDVRVSGYPAKYVYHCIDNGACSENYYVLREDMLIQIGTAYAGPDKEKDAKAFRDLVDSINL